MADKQTLSIQFAPRIVDPDDGDPSGFQVWMQLQGKQGSYLKMEEDGQLSLAAGAANLDEKTCESISLYYR